MKPRQAVRQKTSGATSLSCMKMKRRVSFQWSVFEISFNNKSHPASTLDPARFQGEDKDCQRCRRDLSHIAATSTKQCCAHLRLRVAVATGENDVTYSLCRNLRVAPLNQGLYVASFSGQIGYEISKTLRVLNFTYFTLHAPCSGIFASASFIARRQSAYLIFIQY